MTWTTDSTPLPFERVSKNAAMRAMFGPTGPTDRTALGAAHLWYSAVVHLAGEPDARRRAQALSYNPAVWGDYRDIAARMDGWSIAQNVERPDTGEPDVAYVKLLHVDFSGRAFADQRINTADLQWLTLTHDHGCWRVWSISPGDYRPSPQRISTGQD